MPRDKSGKRTKLAAALGLVLLSVLLLHVGPSFELIRPRAASLLPAVVLLALGALLALSCLFKGWRFTAVWCAAVMLPLALGEMGARIWLQRFASAEQQQRFLDSPSDRDSPFAASLHQPHHYTLYNPRPDLALSGGLRHNHLGLRDQREFESKSGAIRIVFLGGSTTYSPLIRDNRQLFTALLEDRLNRAYRDQLGESRFEVVNAGMMSATSAETLLRLIFFVSELKPDLVVIQHGISDTWPRAIGEMQSDFANYVVPWRGRGYLDPRRSLLSTLAMEAVDRSVLLTAVARRFGHKGASILQATRPREGSVRELAKNDSRYFERNTRYMINLSRTMGARVVLASSLIKPKRKGLYSIAVPQHNAVLRRLAEEEGTGFYDFASEMSTDPQYLRQEKYVTPKGSELKSQLFFEYLTRSSLIPALIEQERRREAAAPTGPSRSPALAPEPDATGAER